MPSTTVAASHLAQGRVEYYDTLDFWDAKMENVMELI
jgi:hypothetical protein